MTLEIAYVLTGLTVFGFAVLTFLDGRMRAGLFWTILAAIFCLGGVLPHKVTGGLVIAMALLDARPVSQTAPVLKALGAWVFLPVLLIPAAVFAFGVPGIVWGGLAAMALAADPGILRHGNRINGAMGSVAILPQLLTSVGAILTAAKGGDAIAGWAGTLIPAGNLFAAAAVNCAAMALLTIVLGNSFAAFPVIAAGITVPLLIRGLHADPAMAAMLTLTAGSCGTLVTPMAANFNLVPAALLEMKDRYGVIRYQAPYAVTWWGLHVVILWLALR